MFRKFTREMLTEMDLILSDLRELPADREYFTGITIDNEDSKDLDDAIDIEINSDSYRIYVTIADVSEYLKPGTLLYDEALERVNTIYLSNGNIPMVPRQLSEDKLSLLENELRPGLTFITTISKGLEITGFEIQKTLFRSRRKCHYKEVDNILDARPADPDYELLNNMYMISRMLLDNRQRNGALVIYDLKNLLITNEEGLIKKIKPEDAHKSHIIIQEFMILTNMATAEFSARNELLFLFRNHTARQNTPDRKDILEQMRQVTINLNTLDSLQKRSTLWFNRANYGPLLIGHYGLNIPAYSHVTSPIRRFPDLINHYLLKKQLWNEEPVYTIEDLKDISSKINRKIDEDKDNKKAAIKAREKREAIVEIRESGRSFLQLDHTDFTKLLKNICETGELDEEEANAIMNRLSHNEPRVEQIFILLFEATGLNEKWKELREFTLNLAIKTQGLSIQLINMLVQKNSINNVEIIEQNYSNGFISKIIASINYEKLTTKEYYYHTTKKAAQNLAAQAFIKNYISSTLETYQKNSGIIIANKDDSEFRKEQERVIEHPDDNYVGILNELCSSSLKKATPVFSYYQSGPSHQPDFICTCNLIIGSYTLKTEARSTNKKNSKQFAAKYMIEEINKNTIEKLLENGIDNKYEDIEVHDEAEVDDNYVGNLNDYCLRSGLQVPVYQFTKAGPDHRKVIICQAVLLLPDDPLRYEAAAFNKKIAKQIAAKGLLENVYAKY